MTGAEAGRVVRCAIYTRKSNEKGLDQALTSLDVQRSACENYIRSRASQGWIALPTRYDDPGISGGTMDRPSVQRLIQDIKKGLVDVVVVYKLDRLSRSLKDSLWLFEFFKNQTVEFISITESYDTSTPAGRATLNFLMVMNQYQREDAGERVMCKIKAMAKAGMWIGNNPIIGLDIIDKKLVPNSQERQQALDQFLIYREEKSLLNVARRLNSMGYRLKLWKTKKGKERGGKSYDRFNLYRLLSNRLYVGQIQHHDDVYPGQHEGIIPTELFEEVQAILKENGRDRCSHVRDQFDYWLKGRVRCAWCGYIMVPDFAYSSTNGRAYFYYTCSKIKKTGKEACNVGSVSSSALHSIVERRLTFLSGSTLLVEKMRKEALISLQNGAPKLGQERERLGGEIRKVSGQIENFLEGLAEGKKLGAGVSSIVRRVGELEETKKAMEARLAEIHNEEASNHVQLPEAAEFQEALSQFPEIMKSLSPIKKKELASLMFRSVVYDEKRKEVRLELYPIPGVLPEKLGIVFDSCEIHRRGGDSNSRGGVTA